MLSKHGKTPTSIETLGVRLGKHYQVYYTSDKLNPVLRGFDMLFSLLRLWKKVDYIIIDTYSSLAFYYTLYISQVARLLGISYIPILRGGDLPERLNRSPLLSKWIFQHSYQNIAPSRYLEVTFNKKGFSTQLIPNFVDLKKYPYRERRKIQPKLFWVRSLQWVYNPEMAVRVLALLIEDHPQAELCMVGPDKDGSLHRCRKLAKDLNVLDRVTFTGLLSKEEWIQLSAEYHVFLNTTNHDNTPVSVIEAMALGLPIVSTRAGGLPFLIDDQVNGLLTKVDEPDLMRKAILTLLNDPTLTQRLSQNARKKVEAFDWPVILEKWVSLLSS